MTVHLSLASHCHLFGVWRGVAGPCWTTFKEMRCGHRLHDALAAGTQAPDGPALLPCHVNTGGEMT